MATLRVKNSEGEWVVVSGGGGGGVSGSNTLIIHSDKDFEVIEDGSLAGIISDPNTTYNDIKNAIDNNYNIALKEPRGNLSYCLRADFVLENQESGNKRIALFFTKSILSIRYDIILYIGLNNSIVYMISKNDIFSKQEVEESIDNKAPYVGEEAPTTDTVLWIDPTGTPSGGNGGGNSGGESASGSDIYYIPEGIVNATKLTPYTFSAEECSAFLASMETENVIYATKHFYSPADGFMWMPLTRAVASSETGVFDVWFSGQSIGAKTDTGIKLITNLFVITFIDDNTIKGYPEFFVSEAETLNAS